MKILIILISLLLSISAFSQKQKLIVKIKDLNHFTKIKNQEKIKVKDTNIKLSKALKKYDSSELKQLYPASRRTELLKYYIFETDSAEILQKKIEKEHKNIFASVRKHEEPKPLTLPDDYDYTLPFGNDGLRDVGLTYLDLIRAPDVWEITKGDPNVIIGMHDSHLHTSHEDLSGKIYKVYDDNIRSSFTIKPDHGTMVAGILGASTNNNKGISAIAYNCRIAKTSTTTKEERRNDLILMAQEGMKVLNISQSWLQLEYYQILIDELTEDYNVTVVAAAGNNNSEAYVYPASFNNVISVTSVGHEFDVGTTFNNRKFNWKDCHKKYIDPDLTTYTHTHNDKVDICAPGYVIATLCHPDTYSNSTKIYHLQDGTSFAAPLVSGVCALMYSINPGITPSEIENIIKSTAANIYSIPENSAFIGKLGAGRIDAYEAVKEAGTTYLTGTHGTKSISAGFGFVLDDVTINSSSNIILTARKEITIIKDFEIPLGSTLEMQIDEDAITSGN